MTYQQRNWRTTMFRMHYSRKGFKGSFFLVGTKSELLSFAAMPDVTVLPDPYNPDFLHSFYSKAA
jgi:hypothetical protein